MQEKSRARRNGVNRDEALATAAEKIQVLGKIPCNDGLPNYKDGSVLNTSGVSPCRFFFLC